MTISLHRSHDDPLSLRFTAAEQAFVAVQTTLAELHTLEAARLIRDPFPQATEVLIDLNEIRLPTIDIIDNGSEVLYAAGLSGMDQSYRTADGATLDTVLGWAEDALGQALDAALEIHYHPHELWDPVDRSESRYRVPLPAKPAAVPPAGNVGRLEVVIHRDPDGATEARVFVDGHAQDADITVVDPGRGHTLTDWQENAAHSTNDASTAAARQMLQWFGDAENSPYISA